MTRELIGVLIMMLGIVAIIFFGIWKTVTGDIKSQLSSEFALQKKADNLWIHEMQLSSREVVEKIINIEQPYDREINLQSTSMLLYPEYVVVILSQAGTVRLEVLTHEETYRRYEEFVVNNWGGLSDGTIGKPPQYILPPYIYN